MTDSIKGPGDDPRERLVTNIQVLTGSTLKVETGESQRVVFLTLTSRSLGEATEVEVHQFGLSVDQTVWAAKQLIERAVQLGFEL